MKRTLEQYNGIHPGRILERELERRELKKGPFAISIGEYPQVINEIKTRRGISPLLSLKIDHAFGLEEGTFYMLQAHYGLDQVKKKLKQPNAPVLQKSAFWEYRHG